MKLKKKFGIIIFLAIAMIVFGKQIVFAGYQEWEALDYDVTLYSDGSMNVVETWEVYVSETNTLFKRFKIDQNEKYQIYDTKVAEVVDGVEKNLKEIQEQQNHVDSGCYYGLLIDSSIFEVAWNVGLDNSSDNKIYKISYTVKNAVKTYNDCTELYWQFLSNENVMTGKNITGKIKLPRAVSDIEKLRVWGHGDYNTEIYKKSNSEVEFSLEKLKPNKMLEVRVLIEEDIFPANWNLYQKDHLQEVLKDEQKWADEANAEREEARKNVARMKIFIGIAIIVNIVILGIGITKLKKYREVGKELEEKYAFQKNDLKYFRDIPDEKNTTPARATYMYNFKKNVTNIEGSLSKIFSATMLDLALKGIISFEVISEKEIKICRVNNNQDAVEKLSRDEEMIYSLLSDAMMGEDSITPKEFSKYASKEYDLVYGKLNTLDEIVKEYHKEAGKFSEERTQIYKKWNSKSTIYVLLTILSMFVLPVLPGLFVGSMILAFACEKNSQKVSILSENGYREVAEWKGLKNYMQDYSMLDEKLVPDIVLWEKYLVYATVFGISKKVIEQLKAVHPEMFENMEVNSSLNRSAYWYMMTNTSSGINEFESFTKSLEKVCTSASSAYNTAHSVNSSGSGGGGGFSGGGGGRRRRR